MPKRPRKPLKYPWLVKINIYRIFSIPLGNWLLILLFLVFFFGITYLFLFKGYGTEPSTETFMAEVNSLWSEPHITQYKAYTIYRVSLKKNEGEQFYIICSFRRLCL